MSRNRVLVVDDEPTILRFFQESCESDTVEVIGASDGSKALACLAVSCPDVIFSDLNMTTLDGLALLERARELVPDVPFVIMTGYSDKSKLVRAVQLGAFEFIDKPFSVPLLETVLARALRQRQLYRERRLREIHSQAIQRFSQQINATRTFDDLLQCVRAELSPTLGIRHFSLFFWNDAADRLEFSCGNTAGAEHCPAELETLMHGAIASQQPVLGFTGQAASASLPLLIQRQLVGVLNLGDKLTEPAEIDPIDLTFFAIAADHLASAIAVRQEALQLATALQELEKSRAMLVEAQAIARLGSWRCNLGSGEVSWSEELVRIYGSAPAPGRRVALERIPADDHPLVLGSIEEVARSGRPVTFEHRLIGPGRHRTVVHQVRAVLDGQGRPAELVGTVQDITERKDMENRLLQADRMASTGILAAGVAHEMNNPLAYVVANLDFVAGQLQAVEPMLPAGRLAETRQAVIDSVHGAARVSRIIKDLKTFSRADDETRGPANLNRAIESSLRMAANEIRHRARLVTELGEVPAIDGNEARLGQVFLNLLLNAAQAMPLGSAAKNEVRLSTRFDAGRKVVVVEVSDTGSGIPPEVIGRIFDPFFTTKPIGAGTGLGLSICHGIVAALGGEISVQSEVGKGSTFRVTLPVSSSPPEPAATGDAAPRPGRQPRQRVLVIDDEPMVGVALRRMLANDHEVVNEETASAALARIDAGERFDVILCDLMMPDISGIDFYGALAERPNPGFPQNFIFMTGGAFTPVAADFVARVSAPILGKPVDGKLLRSMISARSR